jgi:hypothetical protein
MTCEMLRKKSGMQIALNDHLKQVRRCKDLTTGDHDYDYDENCDDDNKVNYSSEHISIFYFLVFLSHKEYFRLSI